MRNAAAGLLTSTGKRWLPVRRRIDSKIRLLVSEPLYLSDLLFCAQPHGGPLITRLEDQTLTFCFLLWLPPPPKLWEELPARFRDSPIQDLFKSHLKAHLVSVAFFEIHLLQPSGSCRLFFSSFLLFIVFILSDLLSLSLCLIQMILPFYYCRKALYTLIRLFSVFCIGFDRSALKKYSEVIRIRSQVCVFGGNKSAVSYFIYLISCLCY